MQRAGRFLQGPAAERERRRRLQVDVDVLVREPHLPAGQRLLGLQEVPDEEAEPERDDRKVVTAQAEGGQAEEEAEQHRRAARERERQPHAHARMQGEQRIGVGADREEGRVAEHEEPGVADDDVETEGERDVDQRLDAQADVDPWHHEGEQDEDDREADQEPGEGSGPRERVPCGTGRFRESGPPGPPTHRARCGADGEPERAEQKDEAAEEEGVRGHREEGVLARKDVEHE